MLLIFLTQIEMIEMIFNDIGLSQTQEKAILGVCSSLTK
jgi:hypothetical protein